MRATTAAVAFLAAIPAIHAISLSDFKPYLQNLPTACESAYTQQVSGCTASDFKSGKGCSTSCISGLQALELVVQLACSNADVFGSSNVVNTFLTSDGVKSLCPNAPAAVLTTSSSTTSTTPSPTSTQAAATTTAAASTTEEQTTSSSSSSSTSSTAAVTSNAAVVATTSSSSSSSMASTTSGSATGSTTASSLSSSSSSSAATSSPAFAYSSSASDRSSTSTASSASAKASQNSNNISGGGSPFDSTSMATGITTGSINTFILFLSALLAAYLL